MNSCLEEPLGSFPSQPEYEPNTSLRIEAGMVLEFEPQVVTLDGKKGLHIGSPVAVTETRCKLLGKTWEPEFKIVSGQILAIWMIIKLVVCSVLSKE